MNSYTIKYAITGLNEEREVGLWEGDEFNGHKVTDITSAIDHFELMMNVFGWEETRRSITEIKIGEIKET